MIWTKLPKGEFTGIDWAKPNATTGFDPYLIWAESDNFSGYGDKPPKWLPIAVELTPGTTVQQFIAAASPKWLHVPPVYTSRAAPKGDALMAAGTANQTKLSGAPVTGALFDFAPAINDYLRAHLFGDIFERDNLDWQSRELATVSMLSALQGVDSQLQAHVRISMNTGLTEGQVRQLTDVLAERVAAEPAERAREALARHLATTGPR
jgi:alkylhydroperoxidase/carboxymuconolactone decarboxylase family protein YurZ